MILGATVGTVAITNRSRWVATMKLPSKVRFHDVEVSDGVVLKASIQELDLACIEGLKE